MAVAVLVLAFIQIVVASRPDPEGDQLRLDSFVSLVEQDRVKNAEILDVDAYVIGDYERRAGELARYNVPFSKTSATRRDIEQLLIGNRVPTTVNQQFGKSLVGPATILLPALIFVVIFVYFVLSWRRGSGLFGVRSGARVGADTESGVTFRDVAGQDTAVTELRELSDFLSDPSRFAALGGQIPRGVLLYGAPGCGKTLLARALAGESGASFFSISGSDFVELYVGVGAARVRDLFKSARESAPAIVFIDELDSIGARRAAGASREGARGGTSEQSQALNQLLAEIDGFSPSEGVIVVGATNRPDVLDPALLRPGRFDRAVGLQVPDEAGRLAILEVHARSKALAGDVDLSAIATRAVGMTGADLASIMNEAALLAGRARKREIGQADLEQALERISEAPERQRRLSMRERRIGSGMLSEERVTFEDVAGLDEVIEELAEVREYLADPTRFERMGARTPTGYLLAGPPGSGKTLLARAVAGETHATFVAAAGTEFVEVYVGEGAARIRDLFAEARGTAPAIVFIDELDALGAHRAGQGDHGERAQTLNQLLVELDGFSRRSGVIVMAATNRPDILDSALTRPGRFDRIIELDYPDLEARKAILALHSKNKRIDPQVGLEALARLTRGFSGADLATIVNEAALLAARRRLEEIPASVLEEAMDRVGYGIAGRRRLTDEDRRRVAFHEAGHGLVARALPGGRILHKLTIVSRGRILGAAWMPEADDRLVHSRTMLIERMATLLGGRAAEELVFGELGDGASSDLAQVREIARRMVMRLGMSEAVGPINYGDDFTYNGTPPYSEETARLIDSEVRKLVDEAERLARDVLRGSRDELEAVVEALLERETLTLEEVEEIAGPVAG